MAMAVPSHPWRPAMCLSARLLAPFARVGERGAWAWTIAYRACIVPGSVAVAACFMCGRGNECVDYVNYLSSVDCLGAVGYIVYRALSMARRLISLVFSAVA